jgi:tetratricopeptide (TPR) repeat protein
MNMEAALQQMNLRSIALMQEQRHDEAIGLLIRALSVAHTHMEVDPGTPMVSSLCKSPASAAAAADDACKGVLSSVEINGAEGESDPGPMVTNESSDVRRCTSSVYHRAFCLVVAPREDMQVDEASHASSVVAASSLARSDLGSVAVVILYNLALAFHALGLQRGGGDNGGKYLTKALQLYEKALMALQGVEGLGSGNEGQFPGTRWLLLRMAVHMNQASIYSDQLVDATRATWARNCLIALLGLAVASASHCIGVDELAIFRIEKLRLAMSSYNAAAAA